MEVSILKRVSHFVWTGTIAASLIISLTGCGSSSASQTNTSTNSTASTASTASKTTDGSTNSKPSKTESAKSSSTDQQLVFYSAEGFDADIAKAFEKKTGIKVNMVDMSTGPLLARVQAEKSNPKWDVAWFDGPSSMQGLDNQGMLHKGYKPSNTSLYTDLGKQLQSKDDSYFPVTTTAAGAIGYNTSLVKSTSDLPKDWSDLLNAKYKGSFAMNNPSISGPTYPAVYGLMKLEGNGDLSKGENFFKKLKANGLKVFDSNGPTLTNLVKGNVKYAIAQDSAIIEKIQAGEPIKMIYPTSGVNTLSSNIGIDAKAPHLKAAEEFVNYVLSVEGQNVCAAAKTGDANFEPIIQGVTGRKGIRPDNIKWNAIDPVDGAQHENDIKTWFTQNIVQ